jgi:N-acetyl-anhydromuramyl-L-alanine amidase AmpD
MGQIFPMVYVAGEYQVSSQQSYLLILAGKGLSLHYHIKRCGSMTIVFGYTVFAWHAFQKMSFLLPLLMNFVPEVDAID